MSQLSFSSFDAMLLVRDAQGRYLPASVDQILSVARQAIDQKYQRGALFDAPDVVKDYLSTKLVGFEHEVFAALFLDSKHRLLEYVELFRGTIDQASVYPREVVKEALRINAAAVIFSHNHPSGNPEPSQADKVLTQRLKEALALVDVRTLDHISVGARRPCHLQSRRCSSRRGLRPSFLLRFPYWRHRIAYRYRSGVGEIVYLAKAAFGRFC